MKIPTDHTWRAVRDVLPSPPRRPFGGSFHLTHHQTLLVRAALARGPRAVDAFREWRGTVALREVDVSAQRLLPLVVRTLEAAGGFDDDLLLTQFRKVTRFTWLKSQLLVAEATPALAGLSDAGIPTLIVKGAAVVDRTGGDLAGRPMDDIDVVVPPERAREALSVLGALGFNPAGGMFSDRDADALISHRHALETVSAKGAAIDLHWHTLGGCLRSADKRFWRGADVTTFGDVPCLVTSREDSMVHAVAHAFGSRPQGGLRWASDVTALVRSSEVQVDWDRLIGTADACRVSVAVADALDLLCREVELEVPGAILTALRRAPLTQHVRAWPRLTSSGAPRLPVRAESIVDAYEEYLGQVAVPDPRPTLGGVGRFLAHRWALPSERQVPGHALFVAAGRPWRMRSHWRALIRGGGWSDEVIHLSDAVPACTLGAELCFNLGGDGVAHLARGWSNPEAHGTWSIGSEATVLLRMPEDVSGEFEVTVRLNPFLAPLRQRLRVDLIVNGEQCARWNFQGDSWMPHEVRAPIGGGQLTSGGVVELRFVIAQPLSPEAACLESGTRQLGISLHTLRIDRIMTPAKTR